ncbi:uncharacterized protein BCR38DRAFT_133793 [Pseudomassariella vexata]|uniref:Tyrosinase copper-binding domain-containing protein n=1 Tax=Pseudomassariella vexata TaxID=1141098 RepID=A0A1Y2EAA7_9PEZI|nr:uncharacterized protein BCR38DRAFT_133793 [Pseudomassariella vexata]ORY68518.1 hypothetical protein BCR38DRAFT_133793 [Pseudomassariella vexata]
MRCSLVLPALLGATAISGAVIEKLVKALPLAQFGSFQTISLEQAKKGEDLPNGFNTTTVPGNEVAFKTAALSTAGSVAATCTNPNVRYEWRQYSASDRAAFVDAIACLISKPPSGKWAPAKNRYEDLVRVHQLYMPNIHGNDKFLLWHRYFIWTFEQILRAECGFNRAFPWWDETLDAGKFAASTIFTSAYFGSLPAKGTNGQGACVTTGKFTGTLHLGPGSDNVDHCLSRAVDESLTAQCNQGFVDTCNSRTNFHDMASCAELGPHAYGHNGIGSVMSDVSASPGDPVFFLHHLFIDRNFRIWQNADASRKTSISGCADAKSPCTPLTLDTMVYVGGLRPDVRVRDILDTMNGVMCYRYTY